MANKSKLLTGAALAAIDNTLIDAAKVSREIFVTLAEGNRLVAEGEAKQGAAIEAGMENRPVLGGVFASTFKSYGISKADFIVSKAGARTLPKEHPVLPVLAKGFATFTHGLEPGSDAYKKASKHWSVSKGMGADAIFGLLKINKDGTIAATETAATTRAKGKGKEQAQELANAEARFVAAWIKLSTAQGQPGKGTPFGDAYAVASKCASDWLTPRADAIAKKEKHGKRSK